MNPSNAGYSNLILNYKDDIKLSRYITKTPVSNIDLLPTGPIPPNPIELLSSRSNEEALDSIKKHYDIIILDCPPILGMADTAIMTRFSDANLLVIESGVTKMEYAEKAKKAFEAANSQVTGVIINKASLRGSSYHGYYASSYYSD